MSSRRLEDQPKSVQAAIARMGNKLNAIVDSSRAEYIHRAPPQAIAHDTAGPKLNKTEAEYMRMLARDADIASATPHAIKFSISIPGKRCWYTPDVMVVRTSGIIEIHEIKGAWEEEDARVKRYSAQAQFPWFRWIYAQKTKAGWSIEEQ